MAAATKTTLVTRRADSHGSVARFRNTRRVWVDPALIRTLAVTGTWVLEANSNALSLATDDVGAATGELLVIPYPGQVSDAEIETSNGGTDRGVRIVGCEIMYQVAASALAVADLVIYRTARDAEGVPTTTVVPSTLSTDDADATPLEIDEHRYSEIVAENDRFFLDTANTVHAVMEFGDGTSSDVNIFGAFWHIEEVQE